MQDLSHRGQPSVAKIRPATFADLEAILLLDRAIGEVPHWSAAEYELAISVRSDGPPRCVFAAECDGGMVGFAVGKVALIAEEVVAELETVGVAASSRRSGVGRALCGAVIGWCRGLGASQIELEVRSRSEGPIALYRELGFERTGIRSRYYREPADDAVLMRLVLTVQTIDGSV